MPPHHRLDANERMARWVWRFGRRRRVHGLEAAAPSCTPRLAKHALDRFADAVELLHRYDPRRLTRIRRDLPRIILGGTEAGHAIYSVGLDAAILNLATVTDRGVPVSFLAQSIVHEATHARIARVGIEYSPENRARIERRCVREELAFVERLPEPDRELAASSLRDWLASPSHDFSYEAWIERVADGLRESGLPEWFVQMARRARLRQLDRARRAGQVI
jgi:hypothetical protein